MLNVYLKFKVLVNKLFLNIYFDILIISTSITCILIKLVIGVEITGYLCCHKH